MATGQAAVAASFARERWWLSRPGGYDARRARALAGFLRHELPHARFYAPFAGRPLAELPVVDKQTVLADFAAFNRFGLTLEQALEVAEAAERSRDFADRLPGGVTVGLSSGTTGTRGVFLVSEAESRLWAGMLMGQLMAPASLRTMARRPLRIAFFLRANSNLYETLDSRRVAFTWHDLTLPITDQVDDLVGTDVLVAPASVLRRIAETLVDRGLRERVRPLQVISVAETLDPEDEAVIRSTFGRPVEQIYQATEGLLAVSCPSGRLHLNEAHVHIEPEWIDHQRFRPIITDFTRTTQFVVRHRLDDVLLAAPGPCPCGRPGRSIAAVLGRADDVLLLPSLTPGEPEISVFPDILRHAVALAGDLGDYRIEQHGTQWRLAMTTRDDTALARVAGEIDRLATRLRARPPVVVPMAWPVEAPDQKRRRIRRIS